jgi:hypothetical protein
MEILPHFWISYYKTNLHIIKKKNIKNIIHLSKLETFVKKMDLEEIRIPIDYDDTDSYEEQNNILYQHIFDITDYIHEKILNNENILLLGYESKQDVDAIITAYIIRFGKINTNDAINFLKSKKKYVFEPKCMFYPALNKFYYEINKNI